MNWDEETHKIFESFDVCVLFNDIYERKILCILHKIHSRTLTDFDLFGMVFSFSNSRRMFDDVQSVLIYESPSFQKKQKKKPSKWNGQWVERLWMGRLWFRYSVFVELEIKKLNLIFWAQTSFSFVFDLK